MKKLIYLSAIICLLISVESCHDAKKAKNFNQKTSLDDQGVKFVMEAHEAGLTEIKAASIAQKNSQNPRVINFAKMMITDHTKAGNELNGIANDNYVSVTDTLTNEHKMMIAGMSKKTGNDFDKAYMQMMVADHGKVIDLFHHADENKSKALQDFSEKVMPTLQIHRDSANAICASLK